MGSLIERGALNEQIKTVGALLTGLLDPNKDCLRGTEKHVMWRKEVRDRLAGVRDHHVPVANVNPSSATEAVWNTYQLLEKQLAELKGKLEEDDEKRSQMEARHR